MTEVLRPRSHNAGTKLCPGMPEPRVERVQVHPITLCIHKFLGAVRVQAIRVQRVHDLLK